MHIALTVIHVLMCFAHHRHRPAAVGQGRRHRLGVRRRGQPGGVRLDGHADRARQDHHRHRDRLHDHVVHARDDGRRAAAAPSSASRRAAPAPRAGRSGGARRAGAPATPAPPRPGSAGTGPASLTRMSPRRLAARRAARWSRSPGAGARTAPSTPARRRRRQAGVRRHLHRGADRATSPVSSRTSLTDGASSRGRRADLQRPRQAATRTSIVRRAGRVVEVQPGLPRPHVQAAPERAWHDGQPFTAADVVFTYETMINPKTPTAYGDDFKAVETVEALDPYTVRVRYKQPYAKALQSWGICMLPEHLLERTCTRASSARRPQNRTKPVGTGPYRFKEMEVRREGRAGRQSRLLRGPAVPLARRLPHHPEPGDDLPRAEGQGRRRRAASPRSSTSGRPSTRPSARRTTSTSTRRTSTCTSAST